MMDYYIDTKSNEAQNNGNTSKTMDYNDDTENFMVLWWNACSSVVVSLSSIYIYTLPLNHGERTHTDWHGCWRCFAWEIEQKLIWKAKRKEKPLHYSSDCSFIRCLLYLSVHASKHLQSASRIVYHRKKEWNERKQ